MIKWIIKGYNKVADSIRESIPDKPTWLVKVKLTDTSEIVLEYNGYNAEDVKRQYKSDLTVYNGLVVDSGANRKHINKRKIARIEDIVLVGSSENINDD